MLSSFFSPFSSFFFCCSCIAFTKASRSVTSKANFNKQVYPNALQLGVIKQHFFHSLVITTSIHTNVNKIALWKCNRILFIFSKFSWQWINYCVNNKVKVIHWKIRVLSQYGLSLLCKILQVWTGSLIKFTFAIYMLAKFFWHFH